MFNRLKSVRQVIDLIIEEFTEEELKKLDYTGSSKVYTFKKSLNDVFSNFRVRHDLKRTKKLIKSIIEDYRDDSYSKEARQKMEIEFEVQLFKPTFLFKIEMLWLQKCQKRLERSYQSSYLQFLNS